jgi:hypothetical protein
MVSQLSGAGVLVIWAVTMIALSYFIYRRQGANNTSEFITAGGRGHKWG